MTDLADRFQFHPANTAERREQHETVRTQCGWLAGLLDQLLPDGREKALAGTKLEEVMFWANAAIARQPQEPKTPDQMLDEAAQLATAANHANGHEGEASL